ncbi:MAG: hypothetical protein KJ634_09745 [Gammaproteobacteria bacterium]|nr:hypothetical protein [Gammaproteobacteria bacterium]MBU1415892.1 hypothetical protein [Gammaproteobacteria bacterium]
MAVRHQGVIPAGPAGARELQPFEIRRDEIGGIRTQPRFLGKPRPIVHGCAYAAWRGSKVGTAEPDKRPRFWLQAGWRFQA